MEAPPPYMPPVKKRNTGLIVGLIIGGVLLCCIGPIALIFGGGLFLFNKGKEIAQCQFAFEDLRDSMRSYAAEHNGKLPPAANWQDEIAPYYEKTIATSRSSEERQMIGVMPSSGVWGCGDGSGGKTGIAYNDDVAGKELTKVETSADIVLFEIRQATQNAHSKYAKQSDANAPKIFGSPRGWFLVRMTGKPVLIVKGRETSDIDFN